MIVFQFVAPLSYKSEKQRKQRKGHQYRVYYENKKGVAEKRHHAPYEVIDRLHDLHHAVKRLVHRLHVFVVELGCLVAGKLDLGGFYEELAPKSCADLLILSRRDDIPVIPVDKMNNQSH